MSNGSGSVLSDDSANSFDGTFVGSPTWSTSGAFAGPRNGLDFDGTDDFVEVPASITMPANLTLEAWIYPRDLGSGTRWIAGEQDGARLQLNGPSLEFYIHNGSSLQGPATASITAATWQHVAGTFDGSTLRVYVDGIEGTSASFSGANVDRTNSFFLGGLNGSDSNDVILDEVRLWDTARSRSGIVNNMFIPLQSTTGNLVAYYRFDQDSHASQGFLYDATTNNHHGTLTNMDPATDWVAVDAYNTWIGSDSTDWGTMGNWSRYAVPAAGSNVGVPGYPNSAVATIGTSVTLDNMVVSGGGRITVSSLGSLAVTELLTNTGTLQETRDVSGSTDVAFFSQGSGSGSYLGLAINANGTSLGDTTVAIKGGQECTDNPGETVRRCYDITPTVPTGLNASITFYFSASELNGQNCATLNAYRWTGSSWALLTLDSSYGTGGRMCGVSPRSIRVSGVTDFSRFVLSSSGPTALTLKSFTGRAGTSVAILAALLLLLGAALLIIRREKPIRRS